MQKKFALPHLLLIIFFSLFFAVSRMDSTLPVYQHHRFGPAAPKPNPGRPAKIRNRYSSAE